MSKKSCKVMKINSMILVLTMILSSLSLLSVGVMAEGTDYDAYNYIKITDFSSGTYGTVTDPDAVTVSGRAYGNGSGSIMYTLTAGSSFMAKNSTNPFDTSGSNPAITIGAIKELCGTGNTNRVNAKIKIRFYSEAVGSQFKFTFRNERGNLTSINPQTVTVSSFGWQEAAVDFGTILSRDGSVDSYDHIIIEPGATYNSGDKIYFESVWFERIPQSDVAPDVTGEDIVVLDGLGTRTGDTDNVTATSGYTTNTRQNGAPSYTLVNISGEYPKFEWALTLDENDISASGYSYLNMWMYSPRPQSGGLMAVFNGSGNYRVAAPTVFDWSGWKLVSVEIPSGVTDINKIALCAGKMQGIGTFAYDASQGKFVQNNDKRIFTDKQNTWQCAGTFGIEGIWLSKVEPTGANVGPDQGTYTSETAIAPATGDYVVFDAASGILPNNALSADTSNGRAYNAAVKNINLGRVYTKLDFDTNGNVSKATFVKSGGNVDSGKLYDGESLSIIDGNKNLIYNYINLWMYSPGVKKDQFGNYSEYILMINEGVNERAMVGIPANWTGWKLVSIPITESGFTSIHLDWLKKTGIKTLSITANNYCGGWQNTDIAWEDDALTNLKPDYGDTDEGTFLSRDVSGKEYDPGVTTYGRFNTFGDVCNYVEVERVWLSKEAPNAVFNVVPAEGELTENRDADKTEFKFNVNDNIGLVKGSSNVSYNGNTIIIRYDKLGLGESTALTIPEVYNTDGYKYDDMEIIEISTEDYRYTVDEVNKTVTVDISSALTTAYPNIKLICASYNSGDDKYLTNVLIGTKSGNRLTVDYSSLTDDENSGIRCYLWSDYSSLIPIAQAKVLK